ncbi:MAG TPA: AAA domain-containing protein [Micromonosporaceae bacterium]|nr:AAA domain-containing protein [Micromonosporaceae bacterium]
MATDRRRIGVDGVEQASGPSREGLVAEAGRRWRAQLIDLGGRNTLLYYRDLKAGTLDVGAAAGAPLDALFSGRTVALQQLYPAPDAHAAALRRARTIRNKARELAEERGIAACFLAIGMATWTRPVPGAVPAAPVLLRPAMLRARGAAEEDFELTVSREAELNPTLVHLLATEFDVHLDADEIEELVEHGRPAGMDVASVYERLVKEVAGKVRDFAIAPRCVLGTFSYAKLPMVTDLQAAEHLMSRHDVIAAIAGDRTAQRALQDSAVQVDPAAPDLSAPADEFLVLDADSSQHVAINAVLAGQHTVIKGPPGTGKSQTIANLIASLVAQGRRVLFVAEKRAAITAVTDRLGRRGLGQLVLDVHDGAVSRRRIAAELRGAFDAASRTPLADQAALAQRLVDRRATLNGHVEALHGRREPWGMTAFEVQEALLQLGIAHPGLSTSIRLPADALEKLDAVTAQQVAEQLRDYVTLGGLTLTRADSAWIGADIHTPEQVRDAHRLATTLSTGTLPQTRPWLEGVLAQTGVPAPPRVQDWTAVFALLEGVAATLRTFQPGIFGASLPETVAAAASSAWRREHRDAPGAAASWWRRRGLRRQARALWTGPGKPTREELFAALSAASAQAEQWARVVGDGGPPRVPADLPAAHSAWQRMERELTALAGYVPALALPTLDIDTLISTLARLAADERGLRMVPRLNALAGAISAAGADPLVAELRERPVDPDVAAATFQICWYASILRHLGFADPRLGAFDGVVHTRVAAEYRDTDGRHIDATARRVLRAVAEHITAARDAYPDENRLVEHQANLKRRHLPVRSLFAQAPHLLTALKPCWAMSPLVVSQLLPSDGPYFDVVVFDEASQVTPADAVPALLRARQVVVAGDEHQLPPTAFFTAVEDDQTPVGLTAEGEMDLSLTAGFESVLDVLAALLPTTMLRWHYRSQDDRLIGFSNANIYDGGLVTFPGTAGPGSLRHVLATGVSPAGELPSAPGSASGEPLPPPPSEVDQVVELVLEHAATRPHESLGVIAMGLAHAERVDLALRRALVDRPELHGFFAERNPEAATGAAPFFVKNLERVQGDERDAVILTIGYGKSADGRLPYRFGPLLQAGGERRLNVAITRARRRMTVVSAFTAADMDPSRSGAAGVRLLRAFLAYAESGGVELGSAAAVLPPLGPFQADVRDRLRAAGLPVTAQYGVGGHCIDFVVADPSAPERMVLAIETDAATYRSSRTARDRDRLRQEHLQRLGWRYHRIWSADWFADPERQVALVEAAYLEALDPPAVHTATEVLPMPVGVADERAAGAVPADRVPPVVGPAVAGPPVVEPVAELPAVEPPVVAPAVGAMPRPEIPRGLSILEYRTDQLVALIRWIESDTLLRTEAEVVEAVMRELGFHRRSSRITAVVSAALRTAREQ